MKFIKLLCLYGITYVCVAESKEVAWIKAFDEAKRDTIVEQAFYYYFWLSNETNTISFKPDIATEDSIVKNLHGKIRGFFGEEAWPYLLQKIELSIKNSSSGILPWLDEYSDDFDPDYPKKLTREFIQQHDSAKALGAPETKKPRPMSPTKS